MPPTNVQASFVSASETAHDGANGMGQNKAKNSRSSLTAETSMH